MKKKLWVFLCISAILIINEQIFSREIDGKNMIYGVSTKKYISVVEWDIKNSTFTEVQKIPAGMSATSIARSAKRNLIYVAARKTKNENASNGLIFQMEKDGKLKLKSKVTFAHGYAYLSLDRTENFLMGASYSSGHTDVYKLDEKGYPKLVDTVYENINKAHAVLTTPDNRFAYVPYVKDNNALFQYSFDAKSGKLKPLDPAKAEVDPTAGPRHIVFHPTKPFVYFSNEQQVGVSVYKLNESGQLSLFQICPALDFKMQDGRSASAIEISPDGKFIFTAMRDKTDSTNAIISYKINEDGKVQAVSKTKTDKIPWIIRMTPDGKYLMVSTSSGGTLTAFKLSQSGELTQINSIPWGQGFHDMLIVE